MSSSERGIDHVAVLVRDLDAAQTRFESMGFTLTPRAYHPWGTANHLVQFGRSFIEIVGVADASKIIAHTEKSFSFSAHSQSTLARREGMSMIVFSSTDAKGDTATWAEAADLSLALLEPGMLNRRILDSTFSDAGLVPTVISETNALTTALVMAKDGQSATVMPSSLIEIFGPPEGTVTLPLTDPVLIKPMVLVTPNRGGTRPTVAALKRTAELLHDQF